MSTLYMLSISLLIWYVGIFSYQYIAAWGRTTEVLSAMATPRILSALWISLTTSVVTSVFAIFFGVPLAYTFATKEFKGKQLLKTLSIDLPQTFPPVAVGIILLILLGPQSPLDINIAYTYTALVLAKFFVSAPFVIAFATRKFKEVRETELDIIARTLGANEWQIFWTVFIPLAMKDILAGTSLCWARAMGELGGGLIFAGLIPFKTEDIPMFIATHPQEIAAALAATMLVTTASIIALLLFKKLYREVVHGRSVSSQPHSRI